MSRAPFVMAKSDAAFGRAPEIFDTTLGWRFVNSKLSALYHPYSMGETAENVAEQYHISREMQDQFAHQSQLKYHNAHINGKFKDEIIPIELVTKKQTIIFDTDEHPRLSDTATLAKLKPAFRANGTVTAGNSSGINDGAAALILVSEAVLKAYNLIPKARVVSMAVAGVDPSIMGIGPVPASQKAMQRAGISGSDLGLVELNEAFASQSLASIQELGLNPDIVNINGGSIALGHPLGCSGARISTTLIHEFAKRKNAKFGLATMCIGVGQGAAIVYENLS
jgi:acetyl-CoA acetyltransferase family protein